MHSEVKWIGAGSIDNFVLPEIFMSGYQTLDSIVLLVEDIRSLQFIFVKLFFLAFEISCRKLDFYRRSDISGLSSLKVDRIWIVDA